MTFEHARTGAPRISFISSPRVPPVQAMGDATALHGWTVRQTTTRPTTGRAEARAVKLVRKVARAKTTIFQKKILKAFGPKKSSFRFLMERPICCGESQPVPRVSPWCEPRTIQQATHARSVRRVLTTSREAGGRIRIQHLEASA